jgi:hypothetical protein
MKEIEIFKMKDSNEKLHKKKGLMFDLPLKMLIVGKSQLSGKTNFLGNLLLQDDPRLYRGDFEGENIYIVSPSATTDKKLRTIIEEKEIPNSNIFTDYNENELDNLYEIIKDNFDDAIAMKEKPVHSLIIFDDMSASGLLKKNVNGVMAKIFCNGRHILLSTIITAQKYSDILTTCRENSTAGIFFAGTDRQLQLIGDDHNHYDSRGQFNSLYRKLTNKPHSFMVVNYSNPINTRYMDKNFKPI